MKLNPPPNNMIIRYLSETHYLYTYIYIYIAKDVVERLYLDD